MKKNIRKIQVLKRPYGLLEVIITFYTNVNRKCFISKSSKFIFKNKSTKLLKINTYVHNKCIEKISKLFTHIKKILEKINFKSNENIMEMSRKIKIQLVVNIFFLKKRCSSQIPFPHK